MTFVNWVVVYTFAFPCADVMFQYLSGSAEGWVEHQAPRKTGHEWFMVDVVQLVRTSDCDSEGRGFESHHSPPIAPSRGFFYVFCCA